MPVSSPSEGSLLGGVFARGRVAAEVGDRAFLQAMLDTEAGVVPVEAAEAIAAACQADRFDPAELGELAAAAGNPVVPLVRQLADRLPPEAAGHVHQGATSQDVLDTAAVLGARRARGPLLDDLGGAADACAGLADAHRHTLMAGRTLLQQA